MDKMARRLRETEGGGAACGGGAGGAGGGGGGGGGARGAAARFAAGAAAAARGDDVFLTLTAAAAASTSLTGKARFSEALPAALGRARRAGLLPADDCVQYDGCGEAEGPSAELSVFAEQFGAFDVAGGGEGGGGGGEGDGLVALAECFSEGAARAGAEFGGGSSGSLNATLRTLLEGEVATRVTLRRAAFLAARLAAERRELVARRSGGAGGAEAAALEGRVAVVNKQLATTVDVMVTLREAVSETAKTGAGKRRSRQGWAGVLAGLGADAVRFMRAASRPARARP